VKRIDRVLQRRRILEAARYLPSGANVLDVGCGDGALFSTLPSQIARGIGVDPTLNGDRSWGSVRLLAGRFPDRVRFEGPFDAIVMLAVVEHVPPHEQRVWASACGELLRPGGLLIISAPSPRVDKFLDVMKACRLIDGMALEEHYGYDPVMTPSAFGTESLVLRTQRRFQLGLNNLFVFECVPTVNAASRDEGAA
jgi:2-polyprenyl-3-methyl-5-hydroxy-6-metoxy-1,4-benzoquinol methylase